MQTGVCGLRQGAIAQLAKGASGERGAQGMLSSQIAQFQIVKQRSAVADVGGKFMADEPLPHTPTVHQGG